jgi:small subunit ribosomal protein S30e
MPSHGSLAKAGKIRSMTQKIEGKETHSPVPRVSNYNKYYKRFVLDRGNGQYRPYRRRRRRRR